MRPGDTDTAPRRGGRSLERGRTGPDPIRAGRDALLASLDRPLGTPGRQVDDQRPAAPAASSAEGRARGAAALIGRSPFDEDSDAGKDVPSVPSLAVLRPRRSSAAAADAAGDKPRKRLPSWDDVLFGGAPAARESR
jgi:hypothetical protein